MKNLTYTLIAALSLLASTAQAHPGHDHSHWLSNGIHSIFYLALAGVIGAVAILAIKRIKSKKQEK